MTLAARLTLAQWLSPAFPVGGFAYSQGLEWAIARDEVGTADALAAWMADTLRHGAGRNDTILLCLAVRAGLPDPDLDDLARALAPSRERLEETEAQGAAFAAAAVGLGLAPAPYPVVVGRAARGLDLPLAEVAALWLQAQVTNLVQIAVRLVPLGQSCGQRVLAALHAPILDLAAEAATAGPDALGGAAFRADLGSMQHETMEVRLCRT
ncbi:urease accessory protein UreF [Rhodobaculum claviforme]|uniref:Urease accessory protein UreF n=1 Tax=Rhodobaculum claviforme TaxID=1549854 RepID=A0A934WJR4_9RHOB|nr:urease accessory UreF family protein [Rhodobaculum claviforme]MBK5928139.1 urease accessory protein UreF [Rhodobaculum claviforme]